VTTSHFKSYENTYEFLKQHRTTLILVAHLAGSNKCRTTFRMRLVYWFLFLPS